MVSWVQSYISTQSYSLIRVRLYVPVSQYHCGYCTCVRLGMIFLPYVGKIVCQTGASKLRKTQLLDASHWQLSSMDRAGQIITLAEHHLGQIKGENVFIHSESMFPSIEWALVRANSEVHLYKYI